MKHIDCLVLSEGAEAAFSADILSATVYSYITRAVSAYPACDVYGTGTLAGEDSAVTQISCAGGRQAALEAFLTECSTESGSALVFMQPAPCISAKTVADFIDGDKKSDCAVLAFGDTPVILFASIEKLKRLDISADELSAMDLCKALSASCQYVKGEEGFIIADTMSIYQAQEQLRAQINRYWLEMGVLLIDPATTHISPAAKVGEGTVILPGTIIYGSCKIGESCKLGPNAYIVKAQIGDNVSINSSQVFESKIGNGTAVGPFAYIRPGCDIGERVKIGDFVELKKSSIGDGTKIAHLTYIGDSSLGKRINIGCGVVTANYDGKSKFKTVVEDDSFIGCNVNLVPPLTVHSGAYVATGTTITEDVPGDALAVGRAKPYIKPQWAAQRRKAGKL